MSCYMCYNSRDENSKSLTAPIQKTAVRASKAQYEHAFSEQLFYKMNSVNSTKLYLIKKYELLNTTK